MSLEHLELRYDPFPIGLARPVFSEDLYAELLASYPPFEEFTDADNIGYKYTLSEKYNGKRYADWIRSHAAWREFHAWVKGPDFVTYVLDALVERHVDLNLRYRASSLSRFFSRLRALAVGGSAQKFSRLRPRFEFSMLPAKGGSVVPHADNQAKVVTLIVSMVGEGDWKPEYGGGSEFSKPLDERHLFNRRNDQLEFDEVEPIGCYPFEPNQAVLFVKTFNSWHCVRPMTATEDGVFRRTLTINIEMPD